MHTYPIILYNLRFMRLLLAHLIVRIVRNKQRWCKPLQLAVLSNRYFMGLPFCWILIC